jgi:hypothetical protein
MPDLDDSDICSERTKALFPGTYGEFRWSVVFTQIRLKSGLGRLDFELLQSSSRCDLDSLLPDDELVALTD